MPAESPSSDAASRPLGVCVLAAGKGTRLKSERAKVLHAIAGAPLIEYVLDAARALSPTTLAVVVGHDRDAVQAAVGAESGVTFVVQVPQNGTGHALLVARDALTEVAAADGDVLVLLGDVPLVTDTLLRELVDGHRQSGAAATMLTIEFATADEARGYGRVRRTPEGDVEGVREQRDIPPGHADESIREINTGVFVLKAAVVLPLLDELRADNAQKELYLPDVLPLLRERGQRIQAIRSDSLDVLLGVNTRADLARADAAMRARLATEHMANGVTIVDPSTTYIEKGVVIGRDTVVMPFTVIRRGVRIGEHCEVGPFAHLRVGTDMADRAEVGNFVECKKAVIGEHTKAKHLTYLGDVTVGANANIGAGTIVANYDGTAKHQTEIADGAFIGSGTILVAPVKVGEGAMTAAGAVVTRNRDVPPNTVVAGVPAKPHKQPTAMTESTQSKEPDSSPPRNAQKPDTNFPQLNADKRELSKFLIEHQHKAFFERRLIEWRTIFWFLALFGGIPAALLAAPSDKDVEVDPCIVIVFYGLAVVTGAFMLLLHKRAEANDKGLWMGLQKRLERSVDLTVTPNESGFWTAAGLVLVSIFAPFLVWSSRVRDFTGLRQPEPSLDVSVFRNTVHWFIAEWFLLVLTGAASCGLTLYLLEQL